MNPLPVTDADLNAYVDGQLDASRLAAVEDALARDPALAALGGGHPAPQRRVARCARSVAGRAHPRAPDCRRDGSCRQGVDGRPARWLMPAVAAAASLLVGLGTGWFARDVDLERAGTPTTFTRQAALTHALYASRRESSGGSVGARGKAARDLAVQAPGLRRSTRPT